MDLLTLAFQLIFLPLIITYLVLCVFFHRPTLRLVLMHRKLVGPQFIPLVGPVHIIPFIRYKDTLKWLQKLFIDGWERISAFWIVGLPLVCVNNPDDIELLMGDVQIIASSYLKQYNLKKLPATIQQQKIYRNETSQHSCTSSVVLSSTKHIDKGAEYDLLRAWLQEGLLVSTGAKWHTRRKLLTPTFHFKILEDKSQTMYTHARKFVNKLLEENSQPFCPYQLISSCTLDVIGEAAMGISLNSMDGENPEYKAAIGRTTKAAVFRITTAMTRDCVFNLTPVGKQDAKDVKYLHEFTNKIIAARRSLYSKTRTGNNVDSVGGKIRQTFLDTILEMDMQNVGVWTDSDVREEVDTFLFEGHDTTAALLQFAIFELGQNPDVQELAYAEQYEIFGDESRDAVLADLQQMSYLERFIKECLRLYPPVPYLSRRLTEDLHLNGMPPIGAGTNVVVMPYFVHRNPKLFPDPEKFDTDRFLPEECAKRHPFSYIPFSAGPRNCIGQKFAMMEIKVLLSTILRFAKVEPVTMKADVNLVPFVILRSYEPIEVKILPRH